MTTARSSLRLAASPSRDGTVRLLRIALLLVTATGCGSDAGLRERREDTLTSGVLRIAAEPDVATLVRATAKAFEAGYPAARITVEARNSREAMADVFANRADLAVIGREIEAIERQTATEAGLDMEAYRWARDGVAVVIHPSNPVNQVSFDDLRLVLSDPTVTWSEFGGESRRVIPVLPPPEASVAQFVARALVEREDVVVPAVTAADDSLVQAEVRRRADAIGFVSAARLRPGVKVLAVARTQGMPYVGLDAETVYGRDYPLVRAYQIVSRVPGVKLGGGFITFATSEQGQRLVRDEGFVPATVPVRFTRRLPTAAAHQ